MFHCIITVLSCIILIAESKEGDECIVNTTRNPGRCLLVADCPHIGDITQATICGYKRRSKIICCPLSDGPTAIEPCGDSCRISERKCEEYNAAATCNKIGMVVGGTNATLKEFPHMALLGYNEPNGKKHWMCGGSLISDQYILTAAHCVHRMPIFVAGTRRRKRINTARLGEHDYRQYNSEIQDYGFTIIQHPHYDSQAKMNDIALLKLDGKVTFTEFIRPACLPNKFDPHRPDGIVTGWGVTEFMGKASSNLLKAGLEFASYNACSPIYRSNNVVIDNITQICAGHETSDACQGDSGGPLQVVHPSYECMYTVVGVVSFGIMCGKSVPGVYGRVFGYLDWIENEVWNNN